MSTRLLFDWLAESLESKSKREAAFCIPELLPWKVEEDRAIFRISSVAHLASGKNSKYFQRTTLSRADPGKWGGIVFPTKHLNASFAFASHDQIERDLKTLNAVAKISIPEQLGAYELDLTLLYHENGASSHTPHASLCKAAFRPRIRPQFSSALPIPSGSGDWRCIASGTTRQALIGISEALAGGQPPLTLITGSPGSGKEAYAGAIHYGRKEYWNGTDFEDKKGLFEIVSLGEFNLETLPKRLKPALPKLNKGKGTIFFDEADKASIEVRSHLLRLLESRCYQPDADPKVDCSNISFVVAAGKSLGELRDSKPADFWTRMEMHIDVGDPLMAPTEGDRERVIKAFFCHFWWDACSKWLEGVLCEGNRPKDGQWKDFFDNNKTAMDYAVAFFEQAIGIVTPDTGVLIPSTVADRVSHDFAQMLAPHLSRRSLSLRGVRSCVKAIALDLGSHLLARAVVENPCDNDLEKASSRAAARAVGTVIQVLPG